MLIKVFNLQISLEIFVEIRGNLFDRERERLLVYFRDPIICVLVEDFAEFIPIMVAEKSLFNQLFVLA